MSRKLSRGMAALEKSADGSDYNTITRAGVPVALGFHRGVRHLHDDLYLSEALHPGTDL